MADQALLDAFAPIINALETKEAYILEDKLYIRHEFRDPREIQTRMTYHCLEAGQEVGDDNLVMLGRWAKAMKNGECVKELVTQ